MLSYTYENLLVDKNKLEMALNAYTEASQNNIITLKDAYTPTIITRNQSDFSILTGVKFTGGGQLTNNGVIINDDNTVDICANTCFAKSSCVGALYTDYNKTCAMYSTLPNASSSYSFDPSSNLIIYNHYGGLMPPVTKDKVINTTNYKIQDYLKNQLVILNAAIHGGTPTHGSIYTIGGGTSWTDAITKLDDATASLERAEDEQRISRDIKAKLHNSGLNVTQSKTMYILFIVALLILLALYIRNVTFTIAIFIALILIISVHGSIFLGVFILLIIALYGFYYL